MTDTKCPWLANDGKTHFPQLATDQSADVAVVGAGITGLTSALLLQREGLKVAVLEANRVATGVTSHSTAKLTALHRITYVDLEKTLGREAAAIYAAANEAGIERVASFVSEMSIDCDFSRRSAYTYTTVAELVDRIQEEVEAATCAGLKASFTKQTDLPFAVEGAVRVDNQAQFDPYRYCRHLAQAFVAEGGAIFEHSRVTSFEQDKRCILETERANLRADYVVLATLLPFLDRGGLFARTYPSRSYGIAATLTTNSAPSGMYICAESPVRSVRQLKPDSIIVVGEDHKVGQDPDTNKRYHELEKWASTCFQVSKIEHRWSSQDYIPADGIPYIGRLPMTSGQVLTVTGLNKWGLAMGTTAASMLTDLLMNRENPWQTLFDPARINARAAKNLIGENLNAAKHFFGDRLSALVASDTAKLAVGEAAISEHQGEKVAAYRDENSTLHLCSPVCTHLGCFVQWNKAENSWDCPCHGSRFSPDGAILQGPAQERLATIEE